MASWFARLGLVRTLVSEAKLAFRLLREPRVPVAAKALPFAALLYVLFPLDIVPDLLPLLGQLDDLSLLLLLTQIFRRVSPTHIVEFHQSAVARKQPYAPMPGTDDVIDAEFRREDRPKV